MHSTLETPLEECQYDHYGQIGEEVMSNLMKSLTALNVIATMISSTFQLR
jgi:hypothetical protein